MMMSLTLVFERKDHVGLLERIVLERGSKHKPTQSKAQNVRGRALSVNV